MVFFRGRSHRCAVGTVGAGLGLRLRLQRLHLLLEPLNLFSQPALLALGWLLAMS